MSPSDFELPEEPAPSPAPQHPKRKREQAEQEDIDGKLAAEEPAPLPAPQQPKRKREQGEREDIDEELAAEGDEREESELSKEFEIAEAQCQGMKISPSVKPLITYRPVAGDAEKVLADLPMSATDNVRGSFHFVYLVDNVAGGVDKEEVAKLYKQTRYSELPEHLAVRGNFRQPFTMQIFILDQPDGSYKVLKHIKFQSRLKYSAVEKLALTAGTCHRVDFGTHWRKGPMYLQHMLEKLGGFQIRFYALVPANAAKIVKTTDAMKEGFKFIREKGPKANNQNEFVEWTEGEVIDEKSPIYDEQPDRGHCPENLGLNCGFSREHRVLSPCYPVNHKPLSSHAAGIVLTVLKIALFKG